MAVEIPAVDDPRIFIPISVALKGGKTLVLSVPRFDFIEEPEHEAMTAELGKLDDDTDLSPRQRARLATLVMLKTCIRAADYKRCETLTVGQLNAIREHWIEQSSIPLGEFLASAQSLTTAISEAPPNTTSTSGDGDDATSDAA
jgi:hypothetical protein